jgi:hypothetical protein
VATVWASWQEAATAARGKTCHCASTAAKTGPYQRQAVTSHHGALPAAPPTEKGMWPQVYVGLTSENLA